MAINADFDQVAMVHAGTMAWSSSPVQGIDICLLDRVGGERARTTSLVRYAAGQSFPDQVLHGGEEFLVLQGRLFDENGVYGAGTYVRFPPSETHQPYVDEACILFVKLWQFHPFDRQHVHNHIADIPVLAAEGRPGVRYQCLHKNRYESVHIEHWAPGAQIELKAFGGMEILVLEGGFLEHSDALTRYSWLRLPEGRDLSASVGDTGARVWIKTGHLRAIRLPVANI